MHFCRLLLCFGCRCLRICLVPVYPLQCTELQNSPIMSPSSSPVSQRRKPMADHAGVQHLGLPPVPPRLDLIQKGVIRSPAASPTGSPKVCVVWASRKQSFYLSFHRLNDLDYDLHFNILLLFSFSRAHQARPENRTNPYRHLHLLREILLLHLLLNALLPSPLRAEPPGWHCLPLPQDFPGTCHCPQRLGAQKIPVTWQKVEQEWSAHPNLPTLLLPTSMEGPWAAAPSATDQIHTRTAVRWDTLSKRGVGVCPFQLTILSYPVFILVADCSTEQTSVWSGFE